MSDAKRTRRRPLTAEEWQALAERQHAIERLAAECEEILSEAVPAARMAPYRKAWGKVQSLRHRLESLAFDQAQDGLALFHGPSWIYRAHWR
jgi:hypothetical protein